MIRPPMTRPPKGSKGNGPQVMLVQQLGNRANAAELKHARRVTSKKPTHKSPSDSLLELETKMTRSKARSTRSSRPRIENSKSKHPREKTLHQKRGKSTALLHAGRALSSRGECDPRDETASYDTHSSSNCNRSSGRSSGSSGSQDLANNQHQYECPTQYNSATPSATQLGGGSARMSSNTFANGSRQNTGNVITDRPSVKLHAPAGGHCSFNIFEQQKGQYGQVNSADIRPSDGGNYSMNQNQSASVYQNDNFIHGGYKPAVSSNSYACGHSQNVGNQITDRSSTRRLAPPGGRSNVKFC